jgi:branched-subunit amino acid aminotransferase/4-amino-4-deoxychorismate lyase
LKRSAAALLTPLPDGALPAADVLAELLHRNERAEGRIRVTVTAGSLSGSGDADASLTVAATASPFLGYPDPLYEQGVTVIVSSYRSSPADPLAGHKTTSYLPRLLGLREARSARCMEAVWFTTSKHLAEGCLSNIFVIRDGVIRTPPLDTPVLPGIARAVVLEIARSVAIPVEECPLGIDDLLDAEEAFLTNTMMQVLPVVRVEKKDIGDARVGVTARRLLKEYRRLVKAECQG